MKLRFIAVAQTFAKDLPALDQEYTIHHGYVSEIASDRESKKVANKRKRIDSAIIDVNQMRLFSSAPLSHWFSKTSLSWLKALESQDFKIGCDFSAVNKHSAWLDDFKWWDNEN